MFNAIVSPLYAIHLESKALLRKWVFERCSDHFYHICVIFDNAIHKILLQDLKVRENTFLQFSKNILRNHKGFLHDKSIHNTFWTSKTPQAINWKTESSNIIFLDARFFLSSIISKNNYAARLIFTFSGLSNVGSVNKERSGILIITMLCRVARPKTNLGYK